MNSNIINVRYHMFYIHIQVTEAYIHTISQNWHTYGAIVHDIVPCLLGVYRMPPIYLNTWLELPPGCATKLYKSLPLGLPINFK